MCSSSVAASVAAKEQGSASEALRVFAGRFCGTFLRGAPAKSACDEE